MADLAHTTATPDVHPLAGSSAPGSAHPGFSAVAEMPGAFVPLGNAAADIVAGLARRRQQQFLPDAEVIDLAGRVKALAERHNAGKPRMERLVERVRVANTAPPRSASSEDWDALMGQRFAMEQEIGLKALWKRRHRMLKRLCRWLDRLAPMAPVTLPGLAAKAAASLAASDADKFGMWSEEIARAV